MPHGLPQPVPVAPVLVVDDVLSEAMTLDVLCQSLGVPTLRATSAAQAAAVLTRLRPAAVITDLVMPGADGLDCLFVIAEPTPTVPVMVLTASDRLLLKAAAELGDIYGLTDLVCFAKPLGIAALRDFIARAGVPFRRPLAALH